MSGYSSASDERGLIYSLDKDCIFGHLEYKRDVINSYYVTQKHFRHSNVL